MEKLEISELFSIDNKLSSIADNIIEEDNLSDLKNLIQIFNLNQAKKNALRILKLNSLLDKVQDSMIDRFEKRPGEFSNTDLINYMNTVQSAIDRANKSLTLVDETPTITLNQVNVTVEDPVLNRESREKITNAINALMKLNSAEDTHIEEVIIDEEESSTEELGDENGRNNIDKM